MIRKGIFLFALLTTTAVAELPTVGYVADYYYRQCNNPNLSVPGAGRTELSSEKYVLDIVDLLNNGNTAYGTSTMTDNIVSVGWLMGTLWMLEYADDCCIGGYYDSDSGTCKYDIFAPGLNGCPSGYDTISIVDVVLVGRGEQCPTGMFEYYKSAF